MIKENKSLPSTFEPPQRPNLHAGLSGADRIASTLFSRSCLQHPQHHELVALCPGKSLDSRSPWGERSRPPAFLCVLAVLCARGWITVPALVRSGFAHESRCALE